MNFETIQTLDVSDYNFINSGAVDIIRTAHYIHRPWVHEINFCRFICVMNDGLTRCYRTEGLLHLYCNNRQTAALNLALASKVYQQCRNSQTSLILMKIHENTNVDIRRKIKFGALYSRLVPTKSSTVNRGQS